MTKWASRLGKYVFAQYILLHKLLIHVTFFEIYGDPMWQMKTLKQNIQNISDSTIVCALIDHDTDSYAIILLSEHIYVYVYIYFQCICRVTYILNIVKMFINMMLEKSQENH